MDTGLSFAARSGEAWQAAKRADDDAAVHDRKLARMGSTPTGLRAAQMQEPGSFDASTRKAKADPRSGNITSEANLRDKLASGVQLSESEQHAILMPCINSCLDANMPLIAPLFQRLDKVIDAQIKAASK